MSFSLASRIALVSGAASGLGRATAERFIKQGARVVLCDLHEGDITSLRDSSSAVVCPIDVTSEEQVRAALETGEQAFGRPIDTVVNCAGIGLARKTISGNIAAPRVHDQQSFENILAVNVSGTFNVVRLAVEAMVRGTSSRTSGSSNGVIPDGVIVNTASIAAYDGQMGQVAYSASKGAIVGMTLPLARDLAEHRIRANAIAPGLFRTPLLEALPKQMQQQLGSSVPFPSRLGYPEEFAMLVESIVENPMINGEVIRIDGALRMPPR